MLRFGASTYLIIFTIAFQFHGNAVLCSNNDIDTDSDNDNDIDGNRNDNAVFGIIPDCVLGANNVNFYLWNSQVPSGVIIDSDSEDIPIAKSSKYITILVHGFTSEANNTDYKNLTDTWLKKDPNINIFSVDWKQGACSGGVEILQLLSYPSAVSNTRGVAKKIGDLVVKLIKNHNIELGNVLLVGHSLGAHIAGFAGKNLQNRGIGKLRSMTGLDPAGPGFQLSRCENRLCESDAEVVQNFHTSVGAGSLRRFGNIDFYFEGGVTQPGCSVVDINCSHGKSVEYFSQTIWDETRFSGKKWNSITSPPPTFHQCTDETCTIPGLLAIDLPARGMFWVDVPAQPK